MADFSLPLPEKYLVARFKPVFDKIAAGHCATLLAFPQTGRTALLRFLLASPNIFAKIADQKIKYIFFDIDKTGASFDNLLIEILINLDNEVDKNILFSRDLFLLTEEIYKRVKHLSSPLCFIITLNKTALPVFTEIDRLFVNIRKLNLTISLLWSIDTTFYKSFHQGHSASSLLETIFYFKSFSKEETVYNLKRFYYLKSKKTPVNINKSAMDLTGGIAGLFHSLTNENINSPFVNDIVTVIKNDLNDLPEISNRLLTDEAIKFINAYKVSEINFESFKLSDNPTAQEINLLRFLKNKLNSPVSRDEIAAVLWGPGWERKYSDWAIDKTISRLRKKIKSSNYRIVTVKNLGYELYAQS